MSEPRPLGKTHRPLRRAVTDAIREAIVSGQYPPGERLYEDRIATELEVSRNPVRESLQVLAGEGFVDLEPRRGARVAHIDTGRVLELFEVRQALEGLVAALAAAKRTGDEVNALRQVVADGRDAAADKRVDELPMLNTRFHDLLSSAAHNMLLSDTLARLAGVIRWVYAERIQDRSDESWREHAAITEAIAVGDSDSARELGESHVAAARHAYLRH